MNEEKRIAKAAAEWTVKLGNGMTAAEQDAYFTWLAEDPRHGDQMARYQIAWKGFNLLAEWKPEHSLEPNPDLLEASSQHTTWFRWGGAMLAMAALIAVVFYFNDFGARPADTVVSSQPLQLASSDYLYQVLEDGSEIDLNEGAEARVEYRSDRRYVTLLSGEAHFTVAKDPDRPFIVSAGATEVRAVGTAFGVKLEKDVLEVLVTEGRIQIVGRAPVESLKTTLEEDLRNESEQFSYSHNLAAGQQSVVSMGPDAPLSPVVTNIEEEEIKRLMAWKHELLDFFETPVSEAIETFNRRNEVQMIVEGKALEELPIIGSVRSNRIEDFVRLLDLTIGVEVDRSRAGLIVLKEK